MGRKLLFSVLLLAQVAVYAQEPQALLTLRSDLDAFISDSTFSNAFIGIEVKDLRTGEELFSHNAGRDFAPASNMKLLTTSTALNQLGPDFTYHTSLMAYGYILDDTLFGDLYVVGSGDPTISGRFTNGNVIKTFDDWADTLKLLNVKVVTGNIIGDNRCFDNVPVGGGWSLDWHEYVYWYAARISGLTFNDNCIDLTLKPGKIGTPVQFATQPHTGYVSFVNSSATVNDTVNTLDFYRDAATNVIHIVGNYPLNLDSMMISLTVHDPSRYAVTVLNETLGANGIRVVGRPLVVGDPGSARDFPVPQVMWEVASYTSPPLSQIIDVINKRSQNLWAEQVFRTLGRQKFGLGASGNSRVVETQFLGSVGIDTSRIEIADGSGLSSWDLVSPDDIVKILVAMNKSPLWKYFFDSLPIAGIDGTLQFRMRGTKAEGNVRGKTGFIENARSLSGYLTTADGDLLAYSMFLNHFTTPVDSVNHLQDMICTRLCNFTFK